MKYPESISIADGHHLVVIVVTLKKVHQLRNKHIKLVSYHKYTGRYKRKHFNLHFKCSNAMNRERKTKTNEIKKPKINKTQTSCMEGGGSGGGTCSNPCLRSIYLQRGVCYKLCVVCCMLRVVCCMLHV